MLKSKKRQQTLKSVYRASKNKLNKSITFGKKKSCQKYSNTKENDRSSMNR